MAVFQAQHAVDVDLTGPDCLYVFGDNEASVQGAENGHRLPIRLLDPLGTDRRSRGVKNPACFAGAVGLAELWSSGGKPVNLAAPRSKPAGQRQQAAPRIFYGAAAAVVLLLVCGFMYVVLARHAARSRN